MKSAVCNEGFNAEGFEKTCALLTENGFEGAEIAPLTVFDDGEVITDRVIRRIRRALADTSLAFARFHWLLARPVGLHITTADATSRKRLWAYLRHLVEVSGELGGGNLILGSPSQCNSVGVGYQTAIAYLKEGLAGLAGVASASNSALLLEALPAKEMNLVNTIEDAYSAIRQVNSPSVAGMFDFHNCRDEERSWSELIERYYPYVKHVHLNTEDGGYRVPSDAEGYRPSFDALGSRGYSGWISLEIFQTPQDPPAALKQTREFLDLVA
jgi:sugar phosphate isomerase/epimerase